MRSPVVCVLVLVASLVGRDVVAQRRAAPSGGLWLAGGAGFGWSHVSCAICGSSHEPGAAGFLRLGGATTRYLLIGAEAAIWFGGHGDVDRHAWALSAAAYWYPSARHRLYLKGGVGYASHRAEDGTDVISSTGFGPQLGVGYEFPLDRRWLLAPFFNAVFGAVGGGVKFNGATVQGAANVSVVQVGASLVRH
ncbi:MAG TPA: hypothetical protein VGA20_02995 [Gemmatimonadales bacterium]